MPRKNRKDLAEVPEEILHQIKVELVDHVEEVLKVALLPRVPTGAAAAVAPISA
jgi:ATP-dependent Lon protease